MSSRTDPATIALLGHVALFEGCTHRQLAMVARAMEEYEIEAGAVVVEEGTPGTNFFVIVEGVARVERGRSVLAELGEGDFFGELSLFDGGLRTATVVAESPLIVLVLCAPQLEALVTSAPSVALAMLRELSTRLRRLEEG